MSLRFGGFEIPRTFRYTQDWRTSNGFLKTKRSEGVRIQIQELHTKSQQIKLSGLLLDELYRKVRNKSKYQLSLKATTKSVQSPLPSIYASKNLVLKNGSKCSSKINKAKKQTSCRFERQVKPTLKGFLTFNIPMCLISQMYWTTALFLFRTILWK